MQKLFQMLEKLMASGEEATKNTLKNIQFVSGYTDAIIYMDTSK